MNVFGDRLVQLRHRKLSEEQDKQQGQPKPAAGTAPGAPPSRSENLQIVNKYRNVCRKHVLHNRCNDERCRRDHTMLPPAELNKLWYASLELYPVEFTPEEASASNATDIPLCKHFTGKGCNFGDMCQWRHGDSHEEWARARKVQAERATNGKTPAGASVWSEACDPENPWVLNPRFYSATAW